MKLSRVLGGVPIRSVNIEEERYRRIKEQEILSREVVSYLRRRGVVESGDKPFPTGYQLGQ
ncbi:hypothetical protein KKH59_03690 [Patescibacteria group bacterium]|nr:hypothetical protein [Patescibacteria group bacterium]